MDFFIPKYQLYLVKTFVIFVFSFEDKQQLDSAGVPGVYRAGRPPDQHLRLSLRARGAAACRHQGAAGQQRPAGSDGRQVRLSSGSERKKNIQEAKGGWNLKCRYVFPSWFNQSAEDVN